MSNLSVGADTELLVETGLPSIFDETVHDIHKKIIDTEPTLDRLEQSPGVAKAVETKLSGLETRSESIQTPAEELGEPAEKKIEAFSTLADGEQQKLAGIGLSLEFLVESEGRAHSLRQTLEDLFSRIERKTGTVNALNEDLAHARAVRAEWQADALHARQREIRGALERQESQLVKLDGVWRKLDAMGDEAEARQETLIAATKVVDKLQEAVTKADNHVEQVQKTNENVERVRREIDELSGACNTVRSDAQSVLESKKEVAETKDKLDELLQQTHALDDRINVIDSKRSSLQKAEFKIATLQNLLNNIEKRVASVKGQRAVIVHASEKMSQLEFVIRRAEAATAALDGARKLAELRPESVRTDGTRLLPGKRGSRRPIPRPNGTVNDMPGDSRTEMDFLFPHEETEKHFDPEQRFNGGEIETD